MEHTKSKRHLIIEQVLPENLWIYLPNFYLFPFVPGHYSKQLAMKDKNTQGSDNDPTNKIIIPIFNVMNMNNLGILRILLKTLQTNYLLFSS